MHLARLSLQGFKSFAERTTLEFESGITGIVGPNGSGKSNIADAIRWILGEQRIKNLRGTKLEDVVFAGSQGSKPVGMAEVTMVLDNSDGRFNLDYAEIAVSRRVFRSGESEFFINNNPCRLRDIQELFMDTGVGRDAYCVLGQHDIEAILSPNSEDRKRFFEEAAGVVKFRVRKVEAQRRLAETETNLTRLDDILHEIKGQLGPLARQAKKAERYREYQDLLRFSETLLLAERFASGKLQVQELTSNVDRLRAEVAAGSGRQSVEEAGLEEKRLAITTLERELEALRLEELEITRNLEHCLSNQRLAQEKRDRWSDELIRSQKELESVNAAAIQAESNLDERRAAVSEAVALAGSTEDKVGEARQGVLAAQAKLTEAIAESNAAEKNLFEALDRVKALESGLSAARSQGQQAQAELARLTREIDDLEVELADISGQSQAKQNELGLAKERLISLENQAKDMAAAKSGQEGKLSAVRRQLDNYKDKLGRAQSELEALQNLEERGEDLFAGVRRVSLAAKSGQLSGIVGVVADLLEVPRGYELAIETALGSNIQCLVATTDLAAEQAINWLKRQQAGRATFLPLNIIAGRPVPPGELTKLKGITGFVGLASEMVAAKPELATLKEYLLGRSLLAEDLPTARKIAAETGYRYQVVTTEGEIIRPGGSITGGSQRHNSGGLLARKGRITELTRIVEEINKQYTQLEQEAARLDEHRSHLAAEVTKLEREHTETRLHLVAVQKELTALSQTGEALVKRKDGLAERMAGIQTGTSAATEAQLSAELSAANSAQEQAQVLLAQAKAYVVDCQEQLDRQKNTAGQLETGQAIEKEKRNRLQSELDRALALLDSLRIRTDELQSTINQAQQGITAAEAAIEEARLAQEQFGSRKEAVTSQYRVKRDSREGLQADLAERENQLRVQRREVAELTSQLHQHELELTKAQSGQEALLVRAQETYNLTAVEIEKVDLAGADLDQARVQATEMQNKLRLLGPINPEAEAEYHTAQERYDFLTNQYNDLVQAKQDLDNVIAEIEETTEEQFAAAFAQIQKEFGALFVRLFGGGEAFLTLTDPDDLSETGVEIMAQPPGKKLQNLSLLSSGERSLTAISLLLAILRVNPAPFTVLDEVDAALDDANLERFGEVIKEFSAQTQFIIITHRRGTMETADMLYGVTMQKNKGYSEVVSVKLSDVKVG